MRFSLRNLFSAAAYVSGATSNDAIKWSDHDLTTVPRNPLNPLRTSYHPGVEAGPSQRGSRVLLAPEAREKLTLGRYAEWLKSGAVSSAIGLLPIQRVELRKSRRLPFRHEYVLVFVNYQERRYVIRMDRLGKLGSLVKGSRWHSGNVGIGGLSDDCIRVEEEDSAEGQILIDNVGLDDYRSDTIVNLRHWSTSIGDESNCIALWRAAQEIYDCISKRIDELELEIYELKAKHDHNLQSPLLYFIMSTNGGAYVSAASSRFSTFLVGLSAHIHPLVPPLRTFGRRISFQLRHLNFLYAQSTRLFHVITHVGSTIGCGDNELGDSKNSLLQLLHDLNAVRTKCACGREDHELDIFKPLLTQELLESRALVEVTPFLRTNPLDIFRPQSVPIHMTELRQLLDSIPDRVERRFCELSGHASFPRSDSGMVEALRFLSGQHGASGDDVETVDPVQRLQSLYNISRPPLTVLGLADRLEVLSLAWPKYNLVTTNCELFSRSICYLEKPSRFCFASQGYIHAGSTICRLTKPLTAILMMFCYAGCVALVTLALTVTFAVLGISNSEPMVALVVFVLGFSFLILPVVAAQIALLKVKRDCFDHPLWKRYSQKIILPSSWGNGVPPVQTTVALPHRRHPTGVNDTISSVPSRP